jgi:hypothetical protein
VITVSERIFPESSEPQGQLHLFSEEDAPKGDCGEAAAPDPSSDGGNTNIPHPDDGDGDGMVLEWLAQAENDDEADMTLNRVASMIARVAVRVGMQGVRHNETS